MVNSETDIVVTVIERTGYRFPDASARCTAHGRNLCVSCARNPGDCAENEVQSGCSVYAGTGMHWDTCPNRLRDDRLYTLRPGPTGFPHECLCGTPPGWHAPHKLGPS